MTMEQLLTYLEEYFGEKYEGIFRIVMKEYLSKFSSEFYSATFNVLVKRCSRSFGKSPDIYDIESNLGEIYSLIPKKDLAKDFTLEKPEALSEEDNLLTIKLLEKLRAKLRGE